MLLPPLVMVLTYPISRSQLIVSFRKGQKIVKKASHKFPKSKFTSSNVFICQSNSPKS